MASHSEEGMPDNEDDPPDRAPEDGDTRPSERRAVRSAAALSSVIEDVAPAIDAAKLLPTPKEMEIIQSAIGYQDDMLPMAKVLGGTIPEHLIGTDLPEHFAKTLELSYSPAFQNLSEIAFSPGVEELVSTMEAPIFQSALQQSAKLQLLADSPALKGIHQHALGGVIEDTTIAAKALDGLMADLVDRPPTVLETKLEDLAFPVASFELSNHALDRVLPEFEPRQVDAPFIEKPKHSARDGPAYSSRLETALEAIDPEFAQQLRGAWYAAETRGPDYKRQAAHSMRQLIDDLLRRFAPNESFTAQERRDLTPDGNGINMRARAYKIVRGPENKKEAQFVSAQAESVLKFYRWASDAAHQEIEDLPIEYVLRQGEAIVMGLLHRLDKL